MIAVSKAILPCHASRLCGHSHEGDLETILNLGDNGVDSEEVEKLASPGEGRRNDEDHKHGHLEAQECEYDAVVKRHLEELLRGRF